MINYLIATAVYILYIEYSPTMGNIWIRNGVFAPYNIIRLMIAPLYDWNYWSYASMWMINYPLWLGIVFIIENMREQLNYLI